MGRTLYRYTLREMLLPFGLGLALFTFVLLLARLIKLTELVVNRGLPAWEIVKLISYLLPAFLEVTVPMAMLLGILIAFGRLNSDNEIVALRSTGLSLYQLVPPVATFVVAVTLLTAGLAMWVRPWGNRALRTSLIDLARTNAIAGLRPQAFNDDFPGVVLFAEQVDTGAGRLTHVVVSDHRDEDQHNTVFADGGIIVSDPGSDTLTLRLERGAIHTVDIDGRSSYQTRFESYDVTLDLDETLAGAKADPTDPKELTLGELRAAIAARDRKGEPATSELVEYHRKLSIPFACVIFGLIGFPLSLQPGRAIRIRGVATSLLVIFAYYILMSAGQALAEQGTVPPALGLWLPNLALAPVGTLLLLRAAKERSLLPTWLDGLVR